MPLFPSTFRPRHGFAVLALLSASAMAQPNQPNQPNDALTKANNAINNVSNIIAVFQPYLLKARQLYVDTKQLGQDVKQSTRATLSGNSGGNFNPGYNNVGDNAAPTGNANGGFVIPDNAANNPNGVPPPNMANGQPNDPNNGNTANNPQNYLPNQSLPVNNPATVNNDGTGNWGNQNNALYGNFLDVLTGTIMGAGEAESAPRNVDVIFVAANDSYQLWTPSYARNEVAAEYTSRSTHDAATKWSDANETEIAETRITLGQFDQIQNNSQILNAAKNAQNYGSSITELSRLDGKVFAVKAELESRTVYGLIAVVRQVGTDGSNGYLKIKIKAQGVSGDNGQLNTAAYQR